MPARLGRVTVWIPDPDLACTRVVGRGFRFTCSSCRRRFYGRTVAAARAKLRAHVCS